jgi:hypothetical protein
MAGAHGETKVLISCSEREKERKKSLESTAPSACLVTDLRPPSRPTSYSFQEHKQETKPVTYGSLEHTRSELQQ